MDREDVWRQTDRARMVMASLLEDIAASEWSHRTLCSEWVVSDVAAHMSLAPNATIPFVVRELIRARGDMDEVIRRTAIERSSRQTPEQSIADIAMLVGSRRLAPSTFARDPLLDTLVHTMDIAIPLGRSVVADPIALREAAEWAWRRRFPFFPARRLSGVRLIADDIEWSRGTGPPVRGPIASMLLLVTGRGSAANGLHGDGMDVVRAKSPDDQT